MNTADVPENRYVLTISTDSADSLIAHARALATLLSSESSPRRSTFGPPVDLPAVAATLLKFRATRPHRLAFSAGSVAEAVTKLETFVAHSGAPKHLGAQGVYVNVVEWSVFDQGSQDDDEYLQALAYRGRHDHLAKLWTVGFPVAWCLVYPELADEKPVYLTPTPLRRARFWPEVPGRVGLAVSEEGTVGTRPEVPGPGVPREPVAVGPADPVARKAVTSGLVDELGDLPTRLRVHRITNYLQDTIGALLEYAPGARPSVDSGFFDLGMSSIHLEQVRQKIHGDTGFEPAETSAFDYPTIADFAGYLADEISAHTTSIPSANAGQQREAQPDPGLLDEVDIERLSIDELEHVLAEVLA